MYGKESIHPVAVVNKTFNILVLIAKSLNRDKWTDILVEDFRKLLDTSAAVTWNYRVALFSRSPLSATRIFKPNVVNYTYVSRFPYILVNSGDVIQV
jgi:hypothetical protein